MKVSVPAIEELLSPLLTNTTKDNFTRKGVTENPPLRAELYSTEQMEQHAQKLAMHHVVTFNQLTEQLLKRLSDNEKVLFHVNELLLIVVKEKKTITPAAEWLLDNFYLIEEQIRIAKRYLPRGYSKGLPKLTNGSAAGFPRVYALAIEIILHGDGHIDIHGLQSFIGAYQKEKNLTLGELWAVPIMLRLALIENLSRVAARIAVDRADTALANKWAKTIIETAENNPKDLVLTIADMSRSNPPMVSAFVAEFARKLQWKGMELTLPLHWLEQQLSVTDDTINLMVLTENQNQAANQVSMSNSINSLRFLAKTDWRDFVESMSTVELVLRGDVNNVYANMDFHTRDLYRHRIEILARNSTLSETEVAQVAIDLAKQSYLDNETDKKRAHVGYYLRDEGIEQTEKVAKVHLSFFKAIKKNIKQSLPAFYTVIAILLTALLGGAMLLESTKASTMLWKVLVGVLSFISASQFALSISNWLATLWVKPTPLAKLNFSKGIPQENRTLVIIPTLLANPAQVEKLIEDLEVRFLSNRDPNLLFGLLTDFRDAPDQTMPEDESLIQLAQNKIESLNRKYIRKTNDTFFLFHRPRLYNAVQKVWMGYERKRGKLSELNQLIRGNGKEKFSLIVGEQEIYSTVKYVITLDTDTQLPRESAWKLVGLMAHPLNHPVYDEKKKRVVDGHTIIQPRVAISLHGATRSGFTQLNENDSGIDPYTRVTSDVYQDLFCEGSFIGKGIYEIDAFEKALHNRFPENRILSHDLLEGSYARCGFASDIQFYEDYPSRYQTDISRRHRWIRGDWQIGNWFLPIVPGPDGKAKRNPVSMLSKWKIFDNIRRSVTPIAHVCLLVIGWIILPNPWILTLAIAGITLVPPTLTSLWGAIWKPKEIGFTQHFNNTVGLTSKSILQSLFGLVCLPYEAFINLDAIVRTMWRIHISRKNLLEWNPSGFSNKRSHGLFNTYLTMWIAPALVIGLCVYFFITGSFLQLFISAPFLLMWFLSPGVVSFLDQPLVTSKSELKEDQKMYLRELARKTWLFFENLVGEGDNWLPPDNLQQYPIPVIAHRTSPTNIGLSLLANLSAYDFGYSTITQLIKRTTDTFNTLQKLDRYQGHFYNWYDTQTLTVLNPRYVSTVDSGNMAGHLLTLRQGFLTIQHKRIIEPQIIQGLQDTLRVVTHEVSSNENGLRTPLQSLHQSIETQNFQLPDLKLHLENILNQFQEATNSLEVVGGSMLEAFPNQVRLILEEIIQFAPWLTAPIPEKFKNLKFVSHNSTLVQVAELDQVEQPEVEKLLVLENSDEEKQWLHNTIKSLKEVSEYARVRINTLQTLALQAGEFAEMEYDFLYDKTQHLLAIGYHVTDHSRDVSYYDLLASEARLSFFVAIAQGKIPQESWFALGRRLTTVGNAPVLLSWSGSMFEYLMPNLVMPTYENTLLDEMSIGTVLRQIEYGEQQDVPWGISESCYNLVDAHLTYQYRAFGVPGLGFKRGLGQDLVIAPYATVLSLMVDPKASYDNLVRMKGEGFEGAYGFYEAIDYTPNRLLRGQKHAIIQTFMAHHQGMSFLSLAYLLLDQPMQKRFEADTQFQTALLLLQEQVPKASGFYVGSSDHEDIIPVPITSEIRFIQTAHTPVPEVQLLSNGRYFVMLTNAGGGYSRWKETAVTRWREDSVRDNWGAFCFIKNFDKNEFWSTAHQPTLKEADHYEAIFSQGKVEYRRRDGKIETYTTVVVSPEDDVEVRRIQLTNHSDTKRKLSITSYAEVVLAASSADDSHPAFSNLFVQTEINEHQNAIICTRRPRSKDERPPWMFHLMKVDGVTVKTVSFETDRSKFIGRGNTLVHPQVMDETPLSRSQGSVLDPIVSIQYALTLGPGESVIIDMVTGIADTQELNQHLIDKYQDRHLRDRAFDLSWTHSQVLLRQIGATEADAQLYGKLASSILYLNPALRAQPSVVLRNQRQQPSLWSYSISGDLPIVLLIISDSENISIVKQLIKAKAYWQMKGLAVDLVILNEDSGGYRQVLQDQIQGLIAAGIGVTTSEKQGRIFVRPIDQVTAEDRILFQAVARIIISDKKGILEDQVNKRPTLKPAISKLIATSRYAELEHDVQLPSDLQFFNGNGGFSADGKEYVILSAKDKRTPLPWINVLANPNFGTIISESGSSYTWLENAHEYRLTPWKNDPILDNSGEAFYIRDEESGRFWSPMGLPMLGQSACITRHGFGYSSFEYAEDGIHSHVNVHVDNEAPVKFVTVTIANKSDRSRKLSATGYVQWILGELRSKSVMHISTEYDAINKVLIARNRYNADFQNYVAFFEVDNSNFTYTTDRNEFIGRNGTLQNPEAMGRTHLSGKTGACLDSCAAIQVAFDLEPGSEQKIVFKIGAGKDINEALTTIKHFKVSASADQSLSQVKEFWSKTLGTIQVNTPDPSVNILANGWLLYQVLACRLWGRSGLYQSGGAFGFRDQLQDVLALMHAQPELTRQQILTCASRQFREGDVQHWWHPPTGRGVRTLCSDDFLWLPFVASRYVNTTGDITVLNEQISYLQGRRLNVEEESYYDLPILSDDRATVYDHCKRAIEHALRFGEHGLPLMGSGDWNDGMNMVGIHGKGESVWLAFFLYDVLNRFIKVATLQGDLVFVSECEKQATLLIQNINTHAWDGEWYKRAYFDDGTPLGTKTNDECKIDAISQSWSVLSNGGEVDRSITSMKSANEFLINRDKGIIQLLEPPFDVSELNPGYIKGYVPGVRENGGQYSHAAIWMVMAFAKLGDHEKTSELLKMINPIHHGTTADQVSKYKVEPYVMAADVYGVAPHIGRGGWTWYTGSAGWMYQLILESFLGFKREGNTLQFNPCIPKEWKSFSLVYRFEETDYTIHVHQDGSDKKTLQLDGVVQTDSTLQMTNDRNNHEVKLYL